MMNLLIADPNYSNSSQQIRRYSPQISPSKDRVSNVVFSDNSCSLDLKFHEEDRQRRLSEFKKKQESYMKRREAKILQEAGRWQAIENDHKKSLQKIEIKRLKWKAGQKNNPSEAFNVITLDYDNTHQGNYLRQKDEEKKYREGLRLFNLDARMNSGFNIITGAARLPPLPIRLP